MKKRKIIVTGGLAATMILGGTKASFASTTIASSQPTYSSIPHDSVQFAYSPGTGPSLNDLAGELGIDADDFREELRLGLTPKQALKEQGFSSAQIQKIFNSASSTTKTNKTLIDNEEE